VIWTKVVKPTGAKINRNFLVLFFKKELLAWFLSYRPCHDMRRSALALLPAQPYVTARRVIE
jgi:hypothetical protein